MVISSFPIAQNFESFGAIAQKLWLENKSKNEV